MRVHPSTAVAIRSPGPPGGHQCRVAPHCIEQLPSEPGPASSAPGSPTFDLHP